MARSLARVFALPITIAALGCAHASAPESTPAALPPAAPSHLIVVLHAAGVLELEWRDNSSDETGFMLVEDCGGADDGVLGVVGADQTRAAVEGLEFGRTCSYAVFALGEAGMSLASNVATVTHALGAARPAAEEAIRARS